MHHAGLWLPAPRGIFGVEPGLDRMPVRSRGFSVQSTAVGDRELQFDQVEAGGLFGDRVLDLQPGVHLQEVESPVVVGEELHRPRAGVADRAGGQPGRVEQLGPHARCALNQR